MLHYFFHVIRSDRDAVRDDEGLPFEDDIVARHEGLQSLGDLIKETGSCKFLPFQVSVQIARKGHGIIDLITAQLSSLTQP